MALLSRSQKGAWINTAGLRSWEQAGKRYAAAAKRVEDAATGAAQEHIAGPMAEAIRSHPATAGAYDHVADAVGVFDRSGRPYVGVPAGHDAHTDAVTMEYGNAEQAPAPHFRSTWLAYGGAANEGFHNRLWGDR